MSPRRFFCVELALRRIVPTPSWPRRIGIAESGALSCPRPFNGHLSGTTRVSWYEKGKTNLDFTEARDNEWQWHQLGHVQVCISLCTTPALPPLSYLQARCHSCCQTNKVKALKAQSTEGMHATNR